MTLVSARIATALVTNPRRCRAATHSMIELCYVLLTEIMNSVIHDGVRSLDGIFKTSWTDSCRGTVTPGILS